MSTTRKLAFKAFALTIVSSVALWTGAAHAQAVQGSDTFQVTANVLGACVVSANDLNFGTYTSGALGATVDTDTTVSVTCPLAQPYEVGIDAGLNASATTTRAMAGGLPAGGANLDYELFTDAARTSVWGNTFGVDTLGGQVGTGLAQIIPIHGRIAGGQTVNPGAFTDTATLSVFF